jgi:hypothetical protein
MSKFVGDKAIGANSGSPVVQPLQIRPQVACFRNIKPLDPEPLAL